MNKVYYNDNEEYCCRVLRARIADGRLPEGTVDNRSISDVPAREIKKYRQVHLFAGIGGFPLALQMANFGRSRSILSAGFPCQDISTAGRGAGLAGKQSGLWWETRAAISVVRPEVVFLENVSALLVRGLEVVLGSLAPLGYRLEWHCVPARYVGAPHQRDRIWIVGVRDVADTSGPSSRMEAHSSGGQERQSAGTRKPEVLRQEDGEIGGEGSGASDKDVADTEVPGKRPRLCKGKPTAKRGRRSGNIGGEGEPNWPTEPAICRVAHGVPHRVARLKCLGNAIVPQCAAYVLNHVLGDSR